MLEKLKKAEEHIYKSGSHIIFFWISMWFSVALFYQFSNKPIMIVLYSALAVGVELLKNYLIRIVKTKTRHGWNWVVFPFMAVYLVTAVISGIATYGSVRVSIEDQEGFANRQNSGTKFVETNVETVDEVIKTLVDSISASVDEKQKLNSLQGAYYTGHEKLSEDVDKTIESIEKLLNTKNEYVNSLNEEEKNIEEVSKRIFDLIGEDVGMSGNDVLFWIFMILIVTLETALFVTGSPFKYLDVEEEKEESEYEEACRYVDAMFKENSSVLNSNEIISENTGISMMACKRYRELLKTLKHRGKELIHVNGTTRANFNGNTIKRVLENYYTLED